MWANECVNRIRSTSRHHRSTSVNCAGDHTKRIDVRISFPFPRVISAMWCSSYCCQTRSAHPFDMLNIAWKESMKWIIYIWRVISCHRRCNVGSDVGCDNVESACVRVVVCVCPRGIANGDLYEDCMAVVSELCTRVHGYENMLCMHTQTHNHFTNRRLCHGTAWHFQATCLTYDFRTTCR